MTEEFVTLETAKLLKERKDLMSIVKILLKRTIIG